ncbi:GNAT family acetyltransferase, partial [Acinetobacter pittii 42F]
MSLEEFLMNIIIRDEQAEDIEAIEELTKAAFQNAEHTSHTEHFIVNSLRAHGQLTISLVAIEDELANSNMRCDSLKSLMIINKLSKF